MKKDVLKVILLLVSVLLSGCKPMSIAIRGDDCKLNGSFEILDDGLPVNWLYYAPETVPNSDFSLISDASEHKDGSRSLKFDIKDCYSIGGWRSPGFFQEFKVIPGETYQVFVSLINTGCWVKVTVSTGMKGIPGTSETFIATRDKISDWKRFERLIQIPANNDNLRFEANILSPGTLWFDDIKILGVNDNRELLLYPYMGNSDCK